MAAVNQLLAARDRGDMGPVGFDLDMTLIDSRSAILASFTALAEDTGTAISLAAVDSRLGIKLEDELSFWYPPDQRAAAAVIYRRHYVRLAEQLTTVLPGALEALAAVRAAGQRVVIITAKHPVSVQPSLKATGITADEVFTFVHGPEKAAVLRRVAAAAYVGDSPPDMAAAAAPRSRRSASPPARSPATTWPARAPMWCSTRWRPSPPGTGPSTSRRAGPAGRAGPADRRRYRIRQVPRVDEQRPGHLSDPQPQRGQRLLAVPPRCGLVLAETGPHAAPEPPRVAPVVAPGRQPGAQLVVIGRP